MFRPTFRLSLLPSVLLCAGLISGCGNGSKTPRAAEGDAPKPTPAAKALSNPTAGKCPVTTDPIDPNVTADLAGKTYAFCCEDCVEQFKKDPAKYLPVAALPKETKEPKPAQTQPPAPPAGEGIAATFGKDTPHALRLPPGWKEQPPANSMRMFQASVPKVKDDVEDAEVTVSKAMGGVDANLKRWAGQFGGDESLKGKRTVKTAGGQEATVAEFEGTYTGMTMGPQKAEPKKDFKMLGAIVTLADGTYFVKFTGPRQTIEANKTAFDKLMESLK